MPSQADYPAVSVVIPSYNHERFIESTLYSVLEQSYKNIELIIIDDGSSDDTFAKAKKWVSLNWSGRPNSLTKTKNKGVAAALNKGIELSSGEYIVFLASDDVLLKNHIESKLNYFNKHHCDGIVNDAAVYSQQGVKDNSVIFNYYSGSDKVYKDNSYLGPEILSNWCIPGSCLMLRRNVTETIGGFKEGKAIEDWEYFSRLIINHKILFIANKLTLYRVHESNVHSTVNIRMLFGFLMTTVIALLNSPYSFQRSFHIFRYATGLSYTLILTINKYCIQKLLKIIT